MTADSNAALATRTQQITELEKSATALVLGTALQTKINELVAEGESLAEELRAVVIDNDETCALATDALQRRAGWVKRVWDVELKPFVAAADTVHKKFISLRNLVVQTGEADATKTKQVRDAFLEEKDRANQRQATQDAEKQQKLEQQSRKDAARETLALGGTKRAAQQILSERSQLPAPAPQASSTPAGTYGRDHWTWRFSVNESAALKKLVKLAAKDPRYLGYLMINESAITAEADSKKSLAKIPGIDFFNDRKIIDRAK